MGVECAGSEKFIKLMSYCFLITNKWSGDFKGS